MTASGPFFQFQADFSIERTAPSSSATSQRSDVRSTNMNASLKPRDPRRTPPAPQQLSSPPSTGGKTLGPPFLLPAMITPPTSQNSSQQTQIFPPPDWHQRMLFEANERVSNLEHRLREDGRMIAHLKMQHELVTIEAENVAHRHAVEQQMLRREVEVLSSVVQRSGMSTSPQLASSQQQVQTTERTAHPARDRALQAENESLRQRLAQVEALLDNHRSDYSSLQEENTGLRKRIRDNREHLNNLRADANLWSIKPQSRNNSSTKPRRTLAHKKSLSVNTRTVTSQPQPIQSTDGLSALLLADQVLSQGSSAMSASAPSTPITGPRARLPKPRRPYASVQSTPATQFEPAEDKSLSAIEEGTVPNFENANQAASILASIVSTSGRKRVHSPGTTVDGGPWLTQSPVDDSQSTSRQDSTRAPLTQAPKKLLNGSQAAQRASFYLKEDLKRRQLSQGSTTTLPSAMTAPLPQGIFGTSMLDTRSPDQSTSNEFGASETPAKRARLSEGSNGTDIGPR